MKRQQFTEEQIIGILKEGDAGAVVTQARCRRAAADPGAGATNQRWSLDFVNDQMATGQRFRMLNIVDDMTR